MKPTPVAPVTCLMRPVLGGRAPVFGSGEEARRRILKGFRRQRGRVWVGGEGDQTGEDGRLEVEDGWGDFSRCPRIRRILLSDGEVFQTQTKTTTWYKCLTILLSSV